MLGARLQKAWDRAQQADGRWKETDSRSPAEFALVSRRKKNAVVAAVQINKRVKMEKEARHQQAQAIKILPPCPADQVGLWGCQASHE